jgi:ADP-ribose pyrophosphatase
MSKSLSARSASGLLPLDRLRLRHRTVRRRHGPLITRELFVRHDAVCVLPYDPQRDEVVLIEQFRVGAWKPGSIPG